MKTPISPKSVALSSLAGLAALALTMSSSCGTTDLQDQLIGQRCFQNSDCRTGLVCVGRVCVAGGIAPDGSNNTNNNGTNNANNTNNTSNNTNNVTDRCDAGPVTCLGDDIGICERRADGSEYVPVPCPEGTECRDGACQSADLEECPVPPFCESDRVAAICTFDEDTGEIDFTVVECPDQTVCQDGSCVPGVMQECEPGERRCVNDDVFQECQVGPDGSTFFTNRGCPGDSTCSNGRCIEQCVDRDGDGFCANQDPRDCRDDLPMVNPMAEETCGNMRDDDCDRQVDEGCSDCCPGGCGAGEFCRSCACEPFDPDVCTSQNQPCNDPNSFENGFACADLFGTGDLRCIGICSTLAADPDSTCPDPTSVCSFEQGNDQGVCLPSCEIMQGCGEPGLGCLPFDSGRGEGICIPNNSGNPIGSSCDPDLFFDCADGAICVDNNGNGNGRCTQACRPFAFAGAPGATDCINGFCVPFSDSFGVCAQDNGRDEGENCRPVNSSCGEDAVGCFPTGQQGDRPQCQRLCRLDEGNDDCNAGDTCFRFGGGGDDQGVGVCVGGFMP
jgi:hypothetical protein